MKLLHATALLCAIATSNNGRGVLVVAAEASESECAADDATCASTPTTNDTSGKTSGGLGPKKPNPNAPAGAEKDKPKQPVMQRINRVDRKKTDRGYDALYNINDNEADEESEEEDSGDSDEVEGTSLPHGQCGLYLAPSALPYAGLGLFAGANIPYDESVNEYLGGTYEGYNDAEDAPLWTDLFVPIGDRYKALPYRGQQRFPSWLGYIWPERIGAMSDLHTKPFPEVPRELWEFDTGLDNADGLEFFLDDLNDDLFEVLPDFEPKQRVSAFVPGIASLANHGIGGDLGLSNIYRINANSRADYEGQEAPWHPGAGAFTPHHKIEFETTKPVKAGMELLIDYGAQFHDTIDAKVSHLMSEAYHAKKAGEDVKDEMRPRQGFVEGIHKKWDEMDHKQLQNCPDELPTEKAKREATEYGFARDSSEFTEGEKPYSDYRANDYHPWTEEEEDDYNPDDDFYPETDDDITKPLPWLEANGMCLSNGKLRVASSSVRYAGRGVFATLKFSKGEVVLPTPLIALREEDFVIYKSDPNQEFVRNTLDKDTVVATELLLNYAFTHPDSPLYLVPSAPLANFINNGGPMGGAEPKSKGANVQVAWPRGGFNTAKLFEWAYNQRRRDHFDNDFESSTFNNPNPWLKDHPIDVMERSGKLALEFVALRDIAAGEEILIDYGPLWDAAWAEYEDRNPYARGGYFRHSIGVPEGFFPDNWLNVGDRYELAEVADLENNPLEPGVALPLTWAHNGKSIGSKYAYVIGLEKGFSDKFKAYSESKGVIELYRRLLTEQEGFLLESDGFDVYKPGTFLNSTTEEDKAMEFFAHRYHSSQWNFNMHFVAAWDEAARKSILTALGEAGFDLAVKALGERFGYDNMTCFHSSFMGVTHCDKSKMHSDIYATHDKSWNIVFPLITVEGTDPELDIMSEDMNTVIAVHYLKDIAYAMGDFGYHQTRPIAYFDPEAEDASQFEETANGVPIRVVFGAYCAQVDETNVAMIRHIYDGDDPAPFADQFQEIPMREVHWDGAAGTASLAKPVGKGY